MSARVAAIAALVLVLLTRVAYAGPTEAEAKAAGRQALIALRVLAYDKQLAERSPGTNVTIALVSSATPEGRAIRECFAAGFAMMPKAKVGGRAIRVVSIDAGNEKAVTAALVAKTPSVVFVLDDLGDKLAPLKTAARARRVLTISLRERDVANGLSVGIVAARERDQIVINLEASRAEGVRFGAGLLQLARLVGDSE
ncbi:MAG: YfiR family protein [Kofleriaceae bacterium]